MHQGTVLLTCRRPEREPNEGLWPAGRRWCGNGPTSPDTVLTTRRVARRCERSLLRPALFPAFPPSPAGKPTHGLRPNWQTHESGNFPAKSVPPRTAFDEVHAHLNAPFLEVQELWTNYFHHWNVSLC